MASGDSLWVLYPHDRQGPPANFATLDIVQDASSPIYSFYVLDFDGNTIEHADFFERVPKQYAGAGFTWDYEYAVDGTDQDEIQLALRMLDLTDASSILSADLGIDTQTASARTDTPANATANEVNQTATAALTHANAGSPAKGQLMLVRLSSVIGVNDDDLQVLSVHIKET